MAIGYISDVRDLSSGGWGEMADATRSYFSDILESAASRYGDTWAGLNTMRTKHEFYQGDEARLRRRLRDNRDNRLDTSRVPTLSSIADFQQANDTMMDYMMANPTIRRYSRSQLIEGYSDKWREPDNTQVLDSDPLYQEVMSGIWDEDEHGNDVHEEFLGMDEPERRLHITEVVSIRNSWANCIAHILAEDEDPTSTTGARLK